MITIVNNRYTLRRWKANLQT